MRLLVTAVVLLLASAANAACVGPDALESRVRTQADAKSFTELGTWFDRHHQYSCAVQAYRSAVKLSPASPGVLALLGASLQSSGDLIGAADALQQSTRLAPNSAPAHLRLAALLEQLQRRQEAKTEWREALRLDPQSPKALDGLSQHLIAEGDYAGAIALLHKSKRDERLTLDLAQAYGKAGALQDAENLLTAAKDQFPSSYPLMNALVTVYVNEGQRQKALQTSHNFAVMHPENAEAQTLHLRLLLLNNNTAEALPLARKLLAGQPRDAYLLYVCGTLERQSGLFEAARNHLELAVRLQPDIYQSHYGLGLVLLKLEDLKGAKGEFEKAIALGTPDAEVHLELATVLKKLGQSSAAEREAQLYREASQSQTDATAAERKAIRAQQELDTGHPSKAVELYRQALDAAPDNALLNYKLSVALDKVGDTAGERDALEKAIQIDPEMAVAHNQLGYLAFRGGSPGSAEQHFRQAVRAAPAFTEAWINLAATLGMQSKLPEAQYAVDTALKLDPQNSQALQLRHDLNMPRQSTLDVGLELYKKGDYASARQQFESAYKSHTTDVRIAILLADTELHLNAAADALALLQPLAEVNSKNMDFEFVYGAALIAVGRRREGVSHVEKVAEVNQNADAHLLVGDTLLDLDEFDHARKHLEAAFRLNPQLPRIHTLVGIARDKTGDTANAETAFREALKLDLDDFQANLYLGAMLFHRRELTQAKPYLDHALKINPADPIARYESAMLKNASGEYEAAAAELEQLERTDPDWLEPHVALATLYYKLHRPEDGAHEREIVERLTAQQQARGAQSK